MKLLNIPKSKLAWLTVALSSLLYIYDYLVRVGPGVLLSSTVTTTALSQHAIIISNSFFYYGYAFMQIPAGVLIDHYGPKKALFGGALLAGVTMLVMPWAHDFYSMCLLRLCCGIGVSFAYIAPLIYAHYQIDKKYFAMVGGGIQLLGSIGAIAGTLPVSLMMIHIGWTKTNIIIGLLGICVSLVFLMLKSIHVTHKRTFYIEWLALKNICRQLHTWLFGLLGLILWSPMLIIAENIGVSLLESRMIPNSRASLFISVMWLCGGIAGPVMGLWSAGSTQQRFRVINFGIVSSLLGSLGFIYFPQFVPWLWVFFAVLISCGSATQCVVFGLVQDTNKDDCLGVALGFQNMCVAISGLTILPIISWLSTQLPYLHSNNISLLQVFQESLILLPLILILGLGCSWYCQRRTE